MSDKELIITCEAVSKSRNWKPACVIIGLPSASSLFIKPACKRILTASADMPIVIFWSMLEIFIISYKFYIQNMIKLQNNAEQKCISKTNCVWKIFQI